MTRSVRDTAGVLDAVQGGAVGDTVRGARAGASVPRRGRRRPRAAAHRRCSRTTRSRPARSIPTASPRPRTRRGCSSRSATRSSTTFPPRSTTRRSSGTSPRLWAVDARVQPPLLGRKVGRPRSPSDVEPLTWTLAEMGRAITAPRLRRGPATRRSSVGRNVAEWWTTGYDLLLTPTLGEPPVAIGTFEHRPRSRCSASSARPVRAVHAARATSPASRRSRCRCTGTPTASRSACSSIAAYGREDVLLRVAAQLEEARPWAGPPSPPFTPEPAHA